MSTTNSNSIDDVSVDTDLIDIRTRYQKALDEKTQKEAEQYKIKAQKSKEKQAEFVNDAQQMIQYVIGLMKENADQANCCTTFRHGSQWDFDDFDFDVKKWDNWQVVMNRLCRYFNERPGFCAQLHNGTLRCEIVLPQGAIAIGSTR